MQIFPAVAVNMAQEGIFCKTDQTIEIYMDALMQNRLEMDGSAFQDPFWEVWENFIYANKRKIEAYLFKFYDAELCLAAASGNQYDFWYFADRCSDFRRV